LGRFELLELLGKSEGSTVWAVHDPRDDRDLIVTLPRVQPADAAAVERWMTPVRQAARLDHPRLAPVVEMGVEENWPCVAVERKLGVSLEQRLVAHPNPAPVEVVGWVCQVLEGLAFAHEAGAAHTDLQLHNVLVNDEGRVLLCGLAAASSQAPARGSGREGTRRGINQAMLAEADVLLAQREAAEGDVLACGLLLHVLLTGQPLLDEPDLARVARRLAPLGRDVVRLPWNTPHPIPEALRAIADRATASLQRQRYLNARTFLRALTGWLEAEALGRDGPLELMLDRLRTVGALPGLPSMSVRLERRQWALFRHIPRASRWRPSAIGRRSLRNSATHRRATWLPMARWPKPPITKSAVWSPASSKPALTTTPCSCSSRTMVPSRPIHATACSTGWCLTAITISIPHAPGRRVH
jgi:non-specific serine/threonine protein kinase